MCLHEIRVAQTRTHLVLFSTSSVLFDDKNVTKMLSWLLYRSMMISPAGPGDAELGTQRTWSRWTWFKSRISNRKIEVALHGMIIAHSCVIIHYLLKTQTHWAHLTVFVFTTVPFRYLSWTCKTPNPSTNPTPTNAVQPHYGCPMPWQWLLKG